MCSSSIDTIINTTSGYLECGLGWFIGGYRRFGVVWGVSTDRSLHKHASQEEHLKVEQWLGRVIAVSIMLVLVTFASFKIYLPWKSLSFRRMFTHIAEVRMRKLNYFHIFLFLQMLNLYS